MTAATAGARRRRAWFFAAIGVLVALVVVELAAGPALTPASRPSSDALSVPGVAAMVRAAQVDPTEITQVAATQHPSPPLAPAAQAMIDGVLLVTLALPARSLALAGRLAVLLGATAVTVAAIARLRYLVALYLSPPFGTLTYLLRFGSFRRSEALVVVTVLVVVKASVCAALIRGAPGSRAAKTLFGLALTSLAASVVTALCYSWAPVTLGNITDALAAAAVALTAVLWAGIGVGRALRRLG